MTRDVRLFVGGAVLLGIAAVAVGADVLAPEDPLALVTTPLQWPGHQWDHPLGSDVLGRDVLSGLIHGGRMTLLIGVVAALISTGLGSLIGIVAGYYGGIIDDVLSKCTELFQTVPQLLLAIVLIVIFGSTIGSVVAAVGISSWPPIARLARGEVLNIKNRDFMQACTAVGMSDLRIIAVHVLPNVIPPILVAGSVVTATSILTESGISFLGLGDPDVVTWGSMIGAGREMIRTEYYLVVIPGVAIIVTLLALNTITEALGDRLNPRLVEERS